MENTKYPYWPWLTDDKGDALTEWFDDTCGDCLTGRCHWGGAESRRGEAAVDAGEDYVSERYGCCGCSRHRASVAARNYSDPHNSVEADALAWREAKRSGAVVVEHD